MDFKSICVRFFRCGRVTPAAWVPGRASAQAPAALAAGSVRQVQGASALAGCRAASPAKQEGGRGELFG